MTTRLILGVVLGVAVGGIMGYFGKCSSGACPLTANPIRGAIFGGILGLLFAFSYAGSLQSQAKESIATEEGAGSLGNMTQEGVVMHVNSVAEFERYVVKAQVPCLADFYSDYCGPCRRLAPTIDKLAKKYGNRAVICKVNMDVARELARPNNIMGIPAVLFFDGGEEVERLVGLRQQGDYEDVLDSMIAERCHANKDESDARL